MAYCRWSSMKGRCDVYAYEDVYGGYTIHLAKRKRKNLDKAPPYPEPELIINSIEEYTKFHKEYQKWLNTEEGQEMQDLDLPFAGETFYEGDLEGLRERMQYLRELGYTFPDTVFEWIDEEIKERDDGDKV